MATELLVIRLSRPFAAKSAANWVMKRGHDTHHLVLSNFYSESDVQSGYVKAGYMNALTNAANAAIYSIVGSSYQALHVLKRLAFN